MTRVLLISDSERVQRVFQSLEPECALQLRSPAALLQGELNLADLPPQYVFVDSRICGFSSDIALRPLKKALPKGAKVVLLAVDDEDALQGRKQGKALLELSLDDDSLAGGVREMLTVRAPRRGKTAGAAASGGKKGGGEGGESAPSAGAPPSAATAPSAVIVPAAPQLAAEEPPTAATGAVQSPALPSHFVQIQQWIADEVATERPDPPVAVQPVKIGEVSDQVAVEPEDGQRLESFAEIMRRAAAARTSVAAAEDFPNDPVEPPKETVPVEAIEPPAAAEAKAEPLPAVRTRRKRPPWGFPMAIALLCLPIIYFAVSVLLHDKPAREGGAKKYPAAKPAPVSDRGPAPLSQAPQLAVKAGVNRLPRFMAGATPDRAYGKAHPGWERYLGERAQYRLLKEGEVFRAMEVMALSGEAISDEIYRRALSEFGGIDSYHVQGSSRKGDLVVEQGVAKDGIRLVIYRKKNDLSMKGVSIYFP